MSQGLARPLLPLFMDGAFVQSGRTFSKLQLDTEMQQNAAKKESDQADVVARASSAAKANNISIHLRLECWTFGPTEPEFMAKLIVR